MIIGDYHTHTTYCDGANTAEEMLNAAIEKGLKYYGFSSHSHLKYDESWNMSCGQQEEYIKEVLFLKEKYKDKMEVLLGTEYDLFSDNDFSKFDYVIGSCHCIVKDGHYIAVDESEDAFVKNTKEFYDEDYYEFVKDYFVHTSLIAEKIKPTFIGHFDLICKFNKDFKFFDENDIRYKQPMFSALETLVKSGIPFELNTSSVFRHSETEPRASAKLWLSALAEMGGNILLTSDAHSCERIGYNFARAEELAKKCGFKNILILTADGFVMERI